MRGGLCKKKARLSKDREIVGKGGRREGKKGRERERGRGERKGKEGREREREGGERGEKGKEEGKGKNEKRYLYCIYWLLTAPKSQR